MKEITICDVTITWLYCETATGVFTGIFGSSLCLLFTSIVDYNNEKTKSYSDYLDFILQFRNKFKKLEPCVLNKEKALSLIKLLNSAEILNNNRKLYKRICSNDRNLKCLFNTINTIGTAVDSFSHCIEINNPNDFDIMFFFKDNSDNIVKSWLDHPNFKEFVMVLNKKAGSEYQLEFEYVYYNPQIGNQFDPNNQIEPWRFPDSNIKMC